MNACGHALIGEVVEAGSVDFTQPNKTKLSRWLERTKGMEDNKTIDRTSNCQLVRCSCHDCGKQELKKPLQEGFTEGQLRVYTKYCDDCLDRIAMQTLGSIMKTL